MAQLNVIFGPMYSGKSSYLLRKINISIEKCEKIIVINHKSDTRYNQNKITNHNNISTDAVLLTNLKEIYTYIKNNSINLEDVDHIYIDESQFFIDLEEVVSELINKSTKLKNNKLEITCVGLDGDFQQNLFNNGQLLKLISKATTVTKLFSKCYKCGTAAPFTSRLIDNKDQILIGSNNIYVASCYIHK
jgi:thymidine kinase